MKDVFYIGADGKHTVQEAEQDNLHTKVMEILGLCSDEPINKFDIEIMKKKINMLHWMKMHEAEFLPGKNNYFIYYDYRYNSYDIYYTQFDKDLGKIYMTKEHCEAFLMKYEGGIGII